MAHEFLKPNIRKSLPKMKGVCLREKKNYITQVLQGCLKIRDFVLCNIEMVPNKDETMFFPSNFHSLREYNSALGE